MITLPGKVLEIIASLKAAGYEIYAVGGSIRDTLMNRPTKGWDFTTNATPEQILSIFPDSFYDNQFGTVGIKIYASPPSEHTEPELIDIFEITTYRSEQGYTDNRHPDVISWGKTLRDDLSRRDFTINAIASDGVEIIDPYNGQTDIRAKIIRTVGAPKERFAEDALRMMRAVRIAAQLGFMIEPGTMTAIQESAGRLNTISAERIRDELFKLLASNFAADGVLVLKNSGILHEILPELELAFDTPQKSPKRHHLYDVGTHLVMALRNCPSDDPLVRLATLLHDIGKPATFRKTPDGVITFYNHEVVGAKIAKSIAVRLRLSKKQSEKLITLIRWHQFTVDERQTDSAIRRFIRHVTKEYLPDMLALRIGDRLGGGALETSWRLELFKKRLEEVQQQPFGVPDLLIDGYMVMKELGIKPGPLIGIALDRLFAEVEAGNLQNTEAALLQRLHELKPELLTPDS